MNRLAKYFFIEKAVDTFEKIEMVIECKRTYEKDGIKIFEYRLDLPYVLENGESYFRHENELECIVTLIGNAVYFFKSFHKAGGKLYECDSEGRPWRDHGPMKPKDFLHPM